MSAGDRLGSPPRVRDGLVGGVVVVWLSVLPGPAGRDEAGARKTTARRGAVARQRQDAQERELKSTRQKWRGGNAPGA